MRKSIKKVLFGAMVLGSACALQSCYFDSTDCYRRDVCTPVEVCEDVCSSYCDFWGCYDVCDTYCHMDDHLQPLPEAGIDRVCSKDPSIINHVVGLLGNQSHEAGYSSILKITSQELKVEG